MARIKLLLAFFGLAVFAAGLGAACYWWEKFARPDLVVTRHMEGKSTLSSERPDLGRRHFDEAVDLLRKGELIAARDRLLYLIRYYPESATHEDARRIVGEINLDLLVSRIPLERKTEHVVRRGEALVSIARRNRTTIDYIMRANGKTTPLIYPNESLVVHPLDFRMEIDLEKERLTVLDGDQLFKEYPILDRHLPEGLKPPVTTTVSEKVAWLDDHPINFQDPDYFACQKWMRSGTMGLFIRHVVSDGEENEAEGRKPYGVMLSKPDLEELYTIISTGSEIALVN